MLQLAQRPGPDLADALTCLRDERRGKGGCRGVPHGCRHRLGITGHFNINLETPNGARAEAEGEDVSGMPACETVLFRHWDPNVLGTLLPLLDGPQQARFLGAATGLALDATDLGRLMAAPRPAGLPAAAPGMLQFSDGQLAELRNARGNASLQRIVNYLREVAPSEVNGLSDQEFRRLVITSTERARQLGLKTELSLGLWSWLWLRTNGSVGSAAPVIQTLTVETGNPDEALKAMFDGMLGRGWRA